MEYNLEMVRGLTFTETIEIKDDTGVAENLTGSTFLMQIRTYPFSEDYLVSATSENGLLVVTAVSGIVDIKLPPVETDKLVYSQSVYDLIQTKASGDKIRIILGRVLVDNGVSRL